MWLKARGKAPGALFCPAPWQKVRIARLCAGAVVCAFKRLSTLAGVERFTPHDLRRTFISTLLDRGADLATVQSLAGHASVSTTTRYDRRGNETKRRTVQLLAVPALELTCGIGD